nr:MAG TPA: hypothetical protein [Caudoviricetes sp.]
MGRKITNPIININYKQNFKRSAHTIMEHGDRNLENKVLAYTFNT